MFDCYVLFYIILCFFQLDLIFDLLGSPTLEEIRSSCDGAKAHVIRSAHRAPSLAALYTLSSQATHEAVHLLCRMLVFDPVSGHYHGYKMRNCQTTKCANLLLLSCLVVDSTVNR